jgi:hypothetical protein
MSIMLRAAVTIVPQSGDGKQGSMFLCWHN